LFCGVKLSRRCSYSASANLAADGLSELPLGGAKPAWHCQLLL